MAAAIAAAATFATAAHAQPYRQVSPDGRVTYSDIPPAAEAVQARSGSDRTAANPVVRPGAPSGPAAAGPEGAGLPYAVRSVAARYPVVLYTATDCTPCNDARAHLARRGVPFAERQVRTSADAAAFRDKGFPEPSFPAATIGSQRLTGFQPGAWDRLLDLAGYPTQSMLPAGWRATAAQPLVADGAQSVPGASGAASGSFPGNSPAEPRAAGPTAAASTSGTGPRPPAMPASGAASASTAGGFRF